MADIFKLFFFWPTFLDINTVFFWARINRSNTAITCLSSRCLSSCFFFLNLQSYLCNMITVILICGLYFLTLCRNRKEWEMVARSARMQERMGFCYLGNHNAVSQAALPFHGAGPPLTLRSVRVYCFLWRRCDSLSFLELFAQTRDGRTLNWNMLPLGASAGSVLMGILFRKQALFLKVLRRCVSTSKAELDRRWHTH